jgi:glycosyltransferase involved in cell wall biosynthesis
MKKALIITYYWPPAGGPGVQRVLNVVEHLPSFGWEPIVLTVENPSSPAKDESLIKRIPENCKVFKTPTREPFNAYKKLTGKDRNAALPKNIGTNAPASFKEKLSRWIRANLFIPDARKGWKNFLIKEGLKIIANEKPDVIFSTSPPHSLQLGAMALAKKSGIPWVCDLRDPWAEAYWETQMPKTPISRKKNLQLEYKVLNTASHITTVGNGIKDLLGPKTTRPVTVIYNGYRELDASFIKTDKFEILHLGNISAMQYADTLYDALKQLPDEIKQKVKLTFLGSVAEEHKEKIAQINDLDIEYLSFLPYVQMAQRARQASMLFLPKLDSAYSKGLISAKLFDYLALRRPVIAITELGSDIGSILRMTDSGKSFLPDERLEMTHHIMKYIELWDKEKGVILEKNDKLLNYSSIHNIGFLTEIFKNLTV